MHRQGTEGFPLSTNSMLMENKQARQIIGSRDIFIVCEFILAFARWTSSLKGSNSKELDMSLEDKEEAKAWISPSRHPW